MSENISHKNQDVRNKNIFPPLIGNWALDHFICNKTMAKINNQKYITIAMWKCLNVMTFITIMHVWYKMAIIVVWLKWLKWVG